MMVSKPEDVRTVFLVGAGPGDQRLFTLAGFEALRDADVVMYDRLVSPVLLLVNKEAELIDVGKTPGGPAVSQDEINRMMIERARGGQRVVRLKGGDPFVFGRGGEEAAALAAAGIPIQLVPGISSAHAAAAAFGIAVTDRRAASALTVVTGSEGGGDAPPIDWEAVAQVGGTIVVMMGWANFDEIAQRLIAAGLPAETPSAAIQGGWTKTQRAVFAPLRELRDRAADYEPPVTVVIGEVTTLATPEVSWSVMGRRVLVTRAAAQAASLVQRLGALNAHVIELPTIEIVPGPPEPIDEAIQRLAEGAYDIVGLTSVNGVLHLWEALQRGGLDSRALAAAKIAAVGSETARALSERGITADLVPERFSTDALAELITQEDLDGQRVLLARAAQARPMLAYRLRQAGAEVDDLALYDVTTPSARPAVLEEVRRGVDVVTLTSPSTALGLVELVGDLVDLDSLHAVCIGPVTAEAARGLGLNVVATAETYTIEGLVQAVGRYISSLGPPAEDPRKAAEESA